MRVKIFTSTNEPDDKDFLITPALIFGQAEWEEPIFMQVDGDYVPVPDGYYDVETDDGKVKVLSVTDGQVKNTKAYGIAISWGYWSVVLGVSFNEKQKA
jgi:hypothetical protein